MLTKRSSWSIGRQRRRLTVMAGLVAVIFAVTQGGNAGSTGQRHSAPPADSAGPRSALSVVALGDSVTAGSACGCAAFPELYAGDLTKASGVPAKADNLGVPGQTSGDLLGQLNDDSSESSRAVIAANIDLITIGANDFAAEHDVTLAGECRVPGAPDCVQDLLPQVQRNVTAIVNRIRNLRAGRPTTVLVTGYWNIFEDGAVARSNFPTKGINASVALTKDVNRSLQAALTGSGAGFVDLLNPFTRNAKNIEVTKLLTADGDHPNAAGQKLIAKQLIGVGLPVLKG